MSGLRDQLLAEAESIFQLQGDHYDAEEAARRSNLLRSVVSKLDDLFEELASHTSTTTYRYYTKQWSQLSKQHIRIMQNELKLRQQCRGCQPIILKPAADSPPACTECDIKQQDVNALTAENDSLHIELERYKLFDAHELVKEGKYRDAAAIYSNMLAFRASEVQRKRETDPAGAFVAEDKVLTIKSALAMTFMDLDNLSTAEDMIREVLQRRKGRREVDAVQSTQRQLCIILRREGSDIHLEEATDIYGEIWHHRPKRKLDAEDAWFLENGHSLALVLAEQNRMDEAIEKLQRLLANCESREHAIVAAQQLSVWLVRQGKAKKAAAIMDNYFFQDSHQFSSEVLRCANLVAAALTQKNNHVHAEPIWRRIYNEVSQDLHSDTPAIFSAGWQLSINLTYLSKYEDAKVILNQILTQNPLATSPNPSPDTLKLHALLAYICRQLNDLPMASAHALIVWQSVRNREPVKDRDILGLGPEYRTGYTLLWASFSKGKVDQDRKLGQMYWKEMHAGVPEQKTLKDCESIAESWRKLAVHIEADSKRRGVRSATAREIRTVCDELELKLEPQTGTSKGT